LPSQTHSQFCHLTSTCTTRIISDRTPTLSSPPVDPTTPINKIKARQLTCQRPALLRPPLLTFNLLGLADRIQRYWVLELTHDSSLSVTSVTDHGAEKSQPPTPHVVAWWLAVTWSQYRPSSLEIQGGGLARVNDWRLKANGELLTAG